MTTLYLTEPYSIANKDGDALIVKIPANKETGTEPRKVTIPLMKVDQVIVMGDSTVTTPTRKRRCLVSRLTGLGLGSQPAQRSALSDRDCRARRAGGR